MKRMELFLNSTLYIILVYMFSLITWSVKDSDQTISIFGVFNMIGIIVILICLTLVLFFYKNTKYAIPLLTSLLFVINNSEITFDTLNQFGFPYIALILIIIGPILHIIRFKPVLKFKALGLSLLLISIAYLIPLLYTEVSLKAVAISGVGTVYFLLYIFISNTVKGDMDYFFKLMIVINLLLVGEFAIKVTRSLMFYNDYGVFNAFRASIDASWNGNLGWANLNDLCFYLTFTLGSYFYYIFKYPEKIVYWILLILPTLTILLTLSRGGYMGYLIAIIGFCIILLSHGSKSHYFYISIMTIFLVVSAYLSKNISIIIIKEFIGSFENGIVGDFYSSRLWIYKKGFDIFKISPFFGRGWIAIDTLSEDYYGRLFMFHSTLIQVLATMGIFGLGTLIFHYYQIIKMFMNQWSLEIKLVLVSYIAVQIHGLIDNVQFSVPFSILIAVLFPLLENSRVKTIFSKNGRKYICVNTLSES